MAHTRAVRILPTLTVAAEAVAVPPAAHTLYDPVWPTLCPHCTASDAHGGADTRAALDRVTEHRPARISRSGVHHAISRGTANCVDAGRESNPARHAPLPAPHRRPAVAKAALGQISRFALPSPAHPLLPCPHHTREPAATRATPATRPAWRPISLFDGTPQGEAPCLLETRVRRARGRASSRRDLLLLHRAAGAALPNRLGEALERLRG